MYKILSYFFSAEKSFINEKSAKNGDLPFFTPLRHRKQAVSGCDVTTQLWCYFECKHFEEILRFLSLK